MREGIRLQIKDISPGCSGSPCRHGFCLWPSATARCGEGAMLNRCFTSLPGRQRCKSHRRSHVMLSRVCRELVQEKRCTVLLQKSNCSCRFVQRLEDCYYPFSSFRSFKGKTISAQWVGFCHTLKENLGSLNVKFTFK